MVGFWVESLGVAMLEHGVTRFMFAIIASHFASTSSTIRGVPEIRGTSSGVLITSDSYYLGVYIGGPSFL